MAGRSNDDQSTDLIFIDGNEGDLQVCGDEDELMNRVWRLSKPPTDMKLNEPMVTAQRIYHQNRVIRNPEACVLPPVNDKAHCPKTDMRKSVKDPCGCCDACPTNASKSVRKQSAVSEKTFYDLVSRPDLTTSGQTQIQNSQQNQQAP